DALPIFGRTPAASRRVDIQAGVFAVSASMTAAAYRGQSSVSSMDTDTRSDSPVGTVASSTREPGANDGGRTGSSYAVAIARASPMALRQSGRLAVTSRSITPSPFASGSTE